MTNINLKAAGVLGLRPGSCMASLANRRSMGVKVGDVIRIESEDHDTVISRQVLMAPRIDGMDQYVFLNDEDLVLLHVNIADNLRVSKDPFGVECP